VLDDLLDNLEVTSSEELEEVDELSDLEELEVGSTDSIKTNEEVVAELQSKEKQVARIGFELEKGYPLFEVRLTPESQMSTVTMDAIKGLISSSTRETKNFEDFEKESETGEKSVEVCMTLVLAIDPNEAPKEKVIGYFKKEKLRHLYQLVRNLEHKFYLDKDRVFSGQKMLAIL
jgi:hypothetical protein